MSLLKRLNAENTAAGTAPATGANAGTSGMPAAGTGSVGTGELFVKPTGTTPPAGSTGDLFQSPPRQTGTLSEQTQQAQRARGTTKQDNFKEMKLRVQNRLIAELDPRMDLSNADEVRRTVEETFTAVLEAEGIVLTRVERLRLFEAIAAEILGFGPIEPLLKDDTVSEVMVNGPKQVYVERAASSS